VTTAALLALPTPALVLDEARMRRNVDRLRAHLGPLGVEIRPHLKTVKSVEAARRVLKDGTGPATVSTLREAGVFSAAGVKDIVYAVGISPDKLPRVLSLRSTGCDLTVVLDSIVQAEAVATASRVSGDRIAVLVEIDSDGHRSGLAADDPKLVEIGRIVAEHATLRGVITHAGESYGAVGAEAQAGFAEKERVAAVGGAQALRFAGLPCPVVSVGSTPTAHCARNLEGVTEVRAGVYVFFDLVMAGIEVCTQDDIALSVLTTVIGHQKERGWIIVDVGWMAMSRDRGTANQAVDQGYGVVCDIHRRPLKDLIIVSANQEHGVVAVRSGSATPLPDLPVGTRLRILPNHACSTAAQFDGYHVVSPEHSNHLAYWPRFRGW
jgi:D-serine deaminase-like pyridoxal phosphate-dependent protein